MIEWVSILSLIGDRVESEHNLLGRCLSWQSLLIEAPEIAEFGQQRIDGKVAYLATLRKNGLPRMHPVTPVVGGGRCFIFADPGSSKVKNFNLNAEFCLHCGMSDSSGSSGEFQISGIARACTDTASRQIAEAACSYRPASVFKLYELMLSEAVATSYRGGRADRRRWLALDSLAVN